MADAKIVLSAEDRASRVLKSLRGEMQGLQGSTVALRGALGALGGAFGAAFSVAGTLGLIKSVTTGLDKLNDLADATGASVENLSALEDIAVRTGTSVDTMGDAVVKLNKALADAKPGSDQAAAFEALGLSIKDLKALDPAEAFQRVAIALQGFATDGNKARLVQELFGRSLREVAPLLKDVAEAGNLAGTGVTAAALEAEKFNKELFALEKSATDAARALVGPLLSSINQTIDKFREGAKEGKSFYRVLFEEQLKLIGLQKQDPPKLDSQAGAGRGFVNPELVKPSLPDILGTPTKKPPAARSGSTKPAADPGISEIFDPEERFRASERAAQAATEEALRIARLTDAERDRADALKLVADNQQRLDDLLGNTPTAKLEEARADMLLLAAAFERGAITAEQFNEAASARLGNVAAEAEKAADAWSVFADEAARNIQDALGDTLQATMEGNWRSIGDSWKRMLDRMVAEALAAKIGQALLGDFGKSGNLGGLAGEAATWLGTFFASAKGNAFGPGGVLAFANGGVVNGATPFAFGGGRLGVMGEAGPEAVMPLKRGRDGKLGVGGGIVVNQTIHVSTSGPGDRRSMAQLQAEIGIATQRAIARNT